MRRDSAILPGSLPPVGINREQAAAFIGIGATLFDRPVTMGRMPQARVIEGRLVWDVSEIADAFRALPHRAEATRLALEEGNPWNDT